MSSVFFSWQQKNIIFSQKQMVAHNVVKDVKHNLQTA